MELEISITEHLGEINKLIDKIKSPNTEYNIVYDKSLGKYIFNIERVDFKISYIPKDLKIIDLDEL